ncbi:MAG: TlpA family protein disulfide reductase [Bacteroides sp.]|nr:TlpA family protein disulfide reductase [Bacteroides sp.]
MKQIGLLLLLFSAYLSGCIGSNENISGETLNYVVKGDVIPDFTITEENGETFSSHDLAGKRSIIFFLHTECSDCARELPTMEAAWKVLKNDPDFVLATIARAQKKVDTDKHWAESGFTMPVYHDPDKKVFNLFANNRVPRMYILDRDKEIIWMGIENFSELGSDEVAKAERIIELVESIQ